MADIVSIIAEVNGQTYDLTKPSTGNVWTKSFSAPNESSGSNNSGQGPGIGAAAQGLGYYPVKVTVKDAYGNSTVITTSTATLGDFLKLKVLEKTSPVATISYPATGGTINNAKPEITFNLTDSGSGINGSEVYIKIDSGEPVKVTSSVEGATATGTYTPVTALAEGSHTIVVYGYDYDGNKSNEASSTFKVDTTPPVLNVTAPAEGLKVNTTSGTVTGTTNDTTSKPVTITITVNNVDQGPVTVESSGAFTKAISYVEGANVVIIKATDSSGLVTSVTRNVEVNTTAPVVTAIALVPNPADGGATVAISVTVQE